LKAIRPETESFEQNITSNATWFDHIRL